MASNIDATKPTTGTAATQSVRDNFLTAKNEISDLQQVRMIRLSSTDDVSSIFQQCAVNNVPQVVSFNQTTFNYPAGNAAFEFDSVNNEVIFKETGIYDVSVSLHVVRQVAGAGTADWSIHSQLKTPSGGVFTNFPSSLRLATFDGTVANFKRFVGISFKSVVTEANTRIRWMQSCTDVSKTVGIISYPAAGALPAAAGVIFSMHRIGGLP